MIRIFMLGLFLSSSSVTAEEWLDYSMGWGYGLAVEDACPTHWLETDPVSGSHLDHEDYTKAKRYVLTFKKEYSTKITDIGCDAARAEVARLLGEAVGVVWGPAR